MSDQENAPLDLTEIVDAITDDWPDTGIGWWSYSDRREVTEMVLNHLRSLPVEQRMAAMGMERSGWSGHRRGAWNEVGRVHDKASVHMDGCIPLYIEKVPDA